MAKQQVVSYDYTCDVCGGVIPDSDGEGATRKLSWEGSSYIVDLCVMHGSQLGDILTELKGFVDAGHRESGRRGRRAVAAASSTTPRAARGRRGSTSASASGTGPKRGDVGAIRVWARENGHQVSERGRIPGALMAAYDAANGASAPPPAAPAEAPTRKRGTRKAAPARKAPGRKRAAKKAAAAASE